MMRWRKLKQPTTFPTWITGTTADDYEIEQRGVFVQFSVYGPRDSKPPHYRTTLGGCNSLAQAKDMAERHAAGNKRALK